jgi:hypothetical protein
VTPRQARERVARLVGLGLVPEAALREVIRRDWDAGSRAHGADVESEITLAIAKRDPHAIVAAWLDEVVAYHRATWAREARAVVSELRAWAARDRDGWDVARASAGMRVSRRPPVDLAAKRALGTARSAAARRGVPRGPARKGCETPSKYRPRGGK